MSTDFYALFNRADPRPIADVTPLDPARASRYASKALTSECENVAGAAEGTRNDTLNKAAFSLGQLVASGHLDREDTWGALANAGRAAGLDDHEIDLTLRSGLGAGTKLPRIVADLPATPTPTILEAVATTLADETNPVATALPILDWHELFSGDDDGEEWIVDPILPARRIIALYSAPKAGKSLLMLEIAVAVARGGDVLGTTVEEARRVLYVDFENDPRGDIRSRLEAMEVGPDDLDGLCYLSFPSLAKLDTPQGAGELVAAARYYGCEVVVIDTVSRAVGGEENDNDTWLAFYRHTGLALKQSGIACIRLDHSGKDVEKGMRGGSAKYGDVDAVWRLTALGETTIQLECTDHRMPVETTSLVLYRESWPLRHTVSGNPREAVFDAKEAAVDRDLDALGVPSSASANECIKRLSEAGKGANRQLVLRVLKTRKLRLDTPSQGGSGTTPEPPGTTRQEVVPGGRLRSRPPEPPAGAGSREPELPLNRGSEQVSCKSCFRPTDAWLAETTGGRCGRCFAETGQTHKETP